MKEGRGREIKEGRGERRKKKEEVDDATVGPRARLVQIIGTCRIPRLPRYSFNFAACLSLNSSQVVREDTWKDRSEPSSRPSSSPLPASFRLYPCIELTLVEWNVTVVSSRTNCPGLFFFFLRGKKLRKGERENFYFGLGVARGMVESIGNHFARLAGNFALNARGYAKRTKHLPFPTK